MTVSALENSDEQITKVRYGTTWSRFRLSLSMSAIRNDDECHHKQTFYIPPITQSMDTFTSGRELLSLSCVVGGIEKSCLRHKRSQPDETVKKSATFSITLVIVLLQHSSSFST